MAYTAVLTKEAVTKHTDKIYRIEVRLVVNDGTDDIFDSTYTVQYNTNSPDMESINAQLVQEMKDGWDKFAAEQNLLGATALDNALSSLQSQVNTYINS